MEKPLSPIRMAASPLATGVLHIKMQSFMVLLEVFIAQVCFDCLRSHFRRGA
jgi:hypothetical protein